MLKKKQSTDGLTNMQIKRYICFMRTQTNKIETEQILLSQRAGQGEWVKVVNKHKLPVMR